MATEYVIDGSRITSLETFYDEISRTVIPGSRRGRNLDAFNDILRGGFGTPDDGFKLRWLNAAFSKRALGYDETVSQLEIRLERCHPTNRKELQTLLCAARAGTGPTVFDWLIEIIRDHGPGGSQPVDNVHLTLD
jgi:RNAse (barnase) inhibitor barstar